MIIGYGYVKGTFDILSTKYNSGYIEGVLKSNGSDLIFIDTVVKHNPLYRPQFKAALSQLKEGDIFMWYKSYHDAFLDMDIFCEIYLKIKKKGATLQFAYNDKPKYIKRICDKKESQIH